MRELRQKLLEAARRRDIDVVVVWRLDRWGRSMADLVLTLEELRDLGVGFVSLTEALDLTTPSGRSLAGLLAVFAEFEREILRERVRAGLAIPGGPESVLVGCVEREAGPSTLPCRASARPQSPANSKSAALPYAAFSHRKITAPQFDAALPKARAI